MASQQLNQEPLKKRLSLFEELDSDINAILSDEKNREKNKVDRVLSEPTSLADAAIDSEPLDMTKTSMEDLKMKLLLPRRSKRQIINIGADGPDEEEAETTDEEEPPKKVEKKSIFLKENDIPLDQNNNLSVRILTKSFNGRKYSSFSIARKKVAGGNDAFNFEMKRDHIVPLLNALRAMLVTSFLGKETRLQHNGHELQFQQRLFQTCSYPIGPEVSVQIQPVSSVAGALCLSFCRDKNGKQFTFKVALTYLPVMYEALERIVSENSEIL